MTISQVDPDVKRLALLFARDVAAGTEEMNAGKAFFKKIGNLFCIMGVGVLRLGSAITGNGFETNTKIVEKLENYKINNPQKIENINTVFESLINNLDKESKKELGARIRHLMAQIPKNPSDTQSDMQLDPQRVMPNPPTNTDTVTETVGKAASRSLNPPESEESKKALAGKMKIRADHGDLEARLFLGNMYRDGYGVEQSYEQAFQHYKTASIRPDAQIELGMLYETGKGTEQSYEKAIEWYKKAADQQNEVAVANLIRLCNEGKWNPKDKEERDKIYQLAKRDDVEGAEQFKENTSQRWGRF